MGDGPGGSDAGGDHPCLQLLDEFQVVGADDKVGISGLFHDSDFAIDVSSFPASGKQSLGFRTRALSMVVAISLASSGRRSRTGTGFSLRMMSLRGAWW